MELVETAKDQAFLRHIEAVPIESSLELYQYYLHDFIRHLVLPFGEDYSIIEDVYQVSL